VDFLHQILDIIRNPGEAIQWGGYIALAVIVFVETGAMVFFLPGDSLLVTAGFYAASGHLNIAFLNLLLIPCAILGDATSYLIGAKTGPLLFNKPRSRLFRPEHVEAAHRFYERHGGKAIIIARFIPIVRTFVPVVAGVGKMSYRAFASFNVIGGAAWVLSMTLIGYFLGTAFPGLVKNIEWVILVVVFVSVLPGFYEWLKARRRARKAAAAEKADA
jgi:membrane-associated protein